MRIPKGSEFYFFLQNSLMSSWTHDLSGPISASVNDYNTGPAQKASGGWRETVDTMLPAQLTRSRCAPLATHSSSYRKGWPMGTRKVPREIKCKAVFSQAHPLALSSAKTGPRGVISACFYNHECAELPRLHTVQELRSESTPSISNTK